MAEPGSKLTSLVSHFVSGRLKTGHPGAPQNQPGDCCEKGW